MFCGTDPNENPKLAALEKIGEEIAEVSACMQAADYRLLELIRKFDEGAGWVPQGARSCAHWLCWRIGLDLGAARERVRVAKALAQLPRISEAMSKGEISYSKVRAVTRIATPDSEEELLTIALGGTASQVERIVRAWRKVDAQEEQKLANERHVERSVQTYTDEDGMLVVRARLTPEAGALFLKALEAAGEVLYKKDRKENSPIETTPTQRRADALKLVAESALDGKLDPGNSGDPYLVIVHADKAVLENPENPGQSVLNGGLDVSAETSRRIACDSSVVEMFHDKEGNVLDVGRKTRSIPPAIRRALDARDPTCRWPGCDNPIVQGHHLEHWANGGETKLSNLLNLCSHHHHCVHDGGYRAELLPNGEAKFTDPKGRLIPAVPPTPPAPDKAFEALKRRALEDGIRITAEEGQPKWGYFPVNLSDAVDGARDRTRRRREQRT